MFSKSLFTALPLLAAFTTLVRADVIPSSPDGSTVVKVGATAEALWTKDSNGTWTDVTVKLMTGDNFNMVEVTSELFGGKDGRGRADRYTNSPRREC
jgi:hypothetical protein